MKRTLVIGLLLVFCVFACAGLGEGEQALFGAWKAVRMISGQSDLDLTGEAALEVGFMIRFEEGGSFETFVYTGGAGSAVRGTYELGSGYQMTLSANNETSQETYRLSGDTLMLTELSGTDITVAYFERCKSEALVGSWRSVSMRVNGTEIDIAGSNSIALGFTFEEDGSCTGLITSGGTDDVREMSYFASSDVLTLVETGSISNILYSLEGDTLICVFGAQNDEGGTVYTLARQ